MNGDRTLVPDSVGVGGCEFRGRRHALIRFEHGGDSTEFVLSLAALGELVAAGDDQRAKMVAAAVV